MLILLLTFVILQTVIGAPANNGPPAFESTSIRKYYVQAEDNLWDYCPGQENKIDNHDSWIKNLHVPEAVRITTKFHKILYFQYTNETYTERIPNPGYMGFLGPPLYLCEGEALWIYFKNNASKDCSLHAHGLQYNKTHEGASYEDGTHGIEALDNFVSPGGTFIYKWFATCPFRLYEGDDDCVIFVYHSHHFVDMEMSSGLHGPIIYCKAGKLKEVNGRLMRVGVDKELIYWLDLNPELESLERDKNLHMCQNYTACKAKLEAHDDDDWLHQWDCDTMNGYRGASGPPAEVCVGDKIVFYLYGLIAELHYFEVRGLTFLLRGHRKAGAPVFPATFTTMTAVPQAVGDFLISCFNSEHHKQGMNAILRVKNCSSNEPDEHLSGNVQIYYIVAKKEIWCYDNGTGEDYYHGTPIDAPGSDSEKYFSTEENRIGGCYYKARFRRFKYQNLTVEIENHESYGLLGPLIVAETGDTLHIHLTNLLGFNISFYMQGTKMDKSQDGTFMKYENVKFVKPSETEIYTYTIPMAVAPGPEDHPCIPYLYFSAYETEAHIAAGLLGPALICTQGKFDCASGRQEGIDFMYFLMFGMFNENRSPFLDLNIEHFTNGDASLKENEAFRESNERFGINGLSYGNLRGLKVCKNKVAAYYILAIGENEALYTPTFVGNSFISEGTSKASKVAVPGFSDTYIMKPHHIGKWSVHSGNVAHYTAGVTAIYDVECCGECPNDPFQDKGIKRKYYIKIEEVMWDYSDNTINLFTGQDYSQEGVHGYTQVRDDPPYLGHIYKKAQYVEYTDASFQYVKPKPEHFGFIGPPIKCNVGDELEIHVFNTAKFNFSLYSPGIGLRNKTDEGIAYNDGIVSMGQSIPPNGKYIYHWRCEKEHGPADDQPNCIARIYSSAVDPARDIYSTLMGPIVCCRPGILDQNNDRTDGVDHEFFLMLQVSDESKSLYFEEAIQQVDPNNERENFSDWDASQEYDCVNGKIYGNGKGIVMDRCQIVVWYHFSMGDSNDIHNDHLHGQVFKTYYNKPISSDVADTFPGTTVTVEMYTNNNGTWLAHCHLADHAGNGMQYTYTVRDKCAKDNH